MPGDNVSITVKLIETLALEEGRRFAIRASMKTTLIAAAALTLAPERAHAQMTIYGLIDLSYGRRVLSDYLGADPDFPAARENGSSEGNSTTRIGLKGTPRLHRSRVWRSAHCGSSATRSPSDCCRTPRASCRSWHHSRGSSRRAAGRPPGRRHRSCLQPGRTTGRGGSFRQPSCLPIPACRFSC